MMAEIFPITDACAENVGKAHETLKQKNTSEKKINPQQRAEISAAKPGAEIIDSLSALEERLKIETADNMLVRKIISLVGTPYRFGGNGNNGIDCSAFVKKVFASLHISLPRTAREQYTLGKEVASKELQKGDLLFFRTYANYASHVGIYLGNKLMVHASSRGKSVTVSSVDTPYFHSRFLGARRIDGSPSQEPPPPEIIELATSL
jgi:cell wall-associated NlpC family hydrolase